MSAVLKSYRIKEAAAYLGLHEVTLAQRAKAGKIPGAAKIGKCWTFDEVGLIAYRNSLSPCPSTAGEEFGGSSYPQNQAQLESLLGLPTRKRRGHSTKNVRARYGDRKSSEKARP